MKNQFESLRQPGIIGRVSHDYTAITIFQRADNSLQLRTAELAPGKHCFGFLLFIDGSRMEMLPGEGQGWFSSDSDAKLYALGLVRSRFPDLPEDFRYSIDVAISKLHNKPLFDF